MPLPPHAIGGLCEARRDWPINPLETARIDCPSAKTSLEFRGSISLSRNPSSSKVEEGTPFLNSLFEDLPHEPLVRMMLPSEFRGSGVPVVEGVLPAKHETDGATRAANGRHETPQLPLWN